MLHPTISQSVGISVIILCGGLVGLIIGGDDKNNIILWSGVFSLIIGFIMLLCALRRCKEVGKLLKLERERQLAQERHLELVRQLEQEQLEQHLEQLEQQQLNNIEPIIVIVHVHNPIAVCEIPIFLVI